MRAGRRPSNRPCIGSIVHRHTLIVVSSTLGILSESKRLHQAAESALHRARLGAARHEVGVGVQPTPLAAGADRAALPLQFARQRAPAAAHRRQGGPGDARRSAALPGSALPRMREDARRWSAKRSSSRPSSPSTRCGWERACRSASTCPPSSASACAADDAVHAGRECPQAGLEPLLEGGGSTSARADGPTTLRVQVADTGRGLGPAWAGHRARQHPRPVELDVRAGGRLVAARQRAARRGREIELPLAAP